MPKTVQRIKTSDFRPSNPDAIFLSLKKHIDENNVGEFQALLTATFWYPGNGLKEDDVSKYNYIPRYSSDAAGYASSYSMPIAGFGTGMEGYTHSYYPVGYDKEPNPDYFSYGMEYGYYHARESILEALFLEHQQLFRDLLLQLARSNNADLHAAFVRAFEINQDLPGTMFSPCNREELATRIKALHAYGEKLIREGEDKGSHVKALASSLDDDLLNVTRQANSETAKIQLLNNKFNFIDKAHSLDRALGYHRGYKEIVLNIVIALTGVGLLAQLGNLYFNRHFFFAFNTKTQNLVEDVTEQLAREKQVMKIR